MAASLIYMPSPFPCSHFRPLQCLRGNWQSRALGDFQYKDEALPPEECKVTAAPDTKSILRIPSEDEFLIVACDGIWDVMSDQVSQLTRVNCSYIDYQ